MIRDIVKIEPDGTRDWKDLADRERIAHWINGDPDHQGMKPELFLESQTESAAIEDVDGTVLYFRISRVLRVDIQFNPDPAMRERTRAALMQHFPWLAESAKAKGFRQIIFDSIHKPLIAFCQRRFKFKLSPNEFVASTSNFTAEKARTASAGAEGSN